MKFINIIFLLFFISCSLNQTQASGVDFRVKSSDIKGGKPVDDKFIFND